MEYEKYVQSLVDEIDSVKRKRKEETENIKYDPRYPKTSFRNAPMMKELIAPPAIKKIPTQEEIYKEMKRKYRTSWKDPGYTNGEFGKLPALKGKVLNEWEIARALMPERSYKFVPGKPKLQNPFNQKQS